MELTGNRAAASVSALQSAKPAHAAAGELNGKFADLAIDPLATRMRTRFFALGTETLVLKERNGSGHELLFPEVYLPRVDGMLFGDFTRRSCAANGLERDRGLEFGAVTLS